MKLSEIEIIPLYDTIQLLDISDEEYFGSKYRGYISNSRLSLINPDQGGSPKKYFEGLGKHMKFSDSMVFGSACHACILQPNDYIVVSSVNRPTSKMGFMADELYKYFPDIKHEHYLQASDKIDYYKGNFSDTKINNVMIKCFPYWESRKNFEQNTTITQTPIYLDPSSRDKLKICLKSVFENEQIQNLLEPQKIIEQPLIINEGTLIMDIQVNIPGKDSIILKLKGKLDNFTVNYDTNEVILNDLKTTRHYVSTFYESFEEYHYARQMGMYSWMLSCYVNKYLNLKNPVYKTNMLLVSTVPDYNSGIYEVSKKQVLEGFNEFKKLIKTVAYYSTFEK